MWQHKHSAVSLWIHSDRQTKAGGPNRRWRDYHAWRLNKPGRLTPCCCWWTNVILSNLQSCISLSIFGLTKFRRSNVTVTYSILLPFLNFNCPWLLIYEESGRVERSTNSLTLWIPCFHSTFGSWSRQPSVYAAFLCGILKTGTGNDEQGRAFQLPKQTIPATGATWWGTCQQWYSAACVASLGTSICIKISLLIYQTHSTALGVFCC